MKTLMAKIWPPYGLFLTDRAINEAGGPASWPAILAHFFDGVARIDEVDLPDAEKLASSVLDAEMKRKDVLEAKAATFIITPAVAIGVASAVVPLTARGSTASIIGALGYAVALVYLLVSAYYAILARRSDPFAVMSAANALDLLACPVRERIARRLSYARQNEDPLRSKSDRLAVAEDLFLIGLSFLAFASCGTVLAHLAGL